MKIAALVPKTNLTVENEIQYLFETKKFNSDSIQFYTFKLDYNTSYKKDKIAFLNELANDVSKKIEDGKYIGINTFVFFCTSSSIMNKDIISFENPAQAIIDEANYKKIKKCMLITPYDDMLGRKIKNELNENKIEVLKMYNLNLLNTKEYYDFGKYELKDFIKKEFKKDYENIIISCTNLPSIKMIDEMQEEMGIEIISSNSAIFNKIIRKLEEQNDKRRV